MSLRNFAWKKQLFNQWHIKEEGIRQTSLDPCFGSSSKHFEII